MTQQIAFIDSLWEANTPTSFNDIAISDSNTKLDLEDYVRFQHLTGNIILEGSVGCGKTTIAQVIAKERLVSPLSIIEINGATWTAETLKELTGAYNWARSNLEVPVVIINEVDRLKEKQYDLRGFLDTYKNTGLVIMTTNHRGNLDDSIIDRSDVFHIKGFTPQQAVDIAQPILKRANLNISDSNLLTLFDSKLFGEETELSLRMIGRTVDKVAMLNTPPTPPKKSSGLRVV
jgi:replication-associated recombination protein RarA